MNWRRKLRGFYAVLDADDEALARTLVFGAGADVLQVRFKPPRPVWTAELLAIGRMARRITREGEALLIVDDRIDVAVAVEADGVHLGQADLPLADARRVAARIAPGQSLLFGVSTHDPQQIGVAIEGGADYLGFGPVFATATKESAGPAQGIRGLSAAVAIAGETPVVAIGGITPPVAAEIAATGAAAACAIGSVNGAADPGAAGRRIGAAWRADR